MLRLRPMIVLFPLLIAAGQLHAADSPSPPVAAASASRPDPAQVRQRLKRSSAEVERLERHVAEQESRSREAAQRLREQDRALEQLRRQLQSMQESSTAESGDH